MDNNINFAPQVDYTSRDYTAIRNDLVDLIPQLAPNWTSRDAADFGMVMVDMFAYMGDLMSYYIDRAANEGFLATASQRSSIIHLARMLGYTPNGIAAATTTLSFSNPTASPVTIPAATQVSTSLVVNGLVSQIIFETDAAVTVPAKSGGVNGTATITATEGSTISSESLGVSNANPYQEFKLANTGVIQGSASVIVAGVLYSYMSTLIDSSGFDAVFTTATDGDGNTYIQFGDGINGRIPPGGQTIVASYRVGAGKLGNLPIGSLTQFVGSYAVTVTNSVAASGGSDEESTDSVRYNAPQSLRSLTRAISLRDYAYLAIQVTGVSRAIADASSSTSVILYITPSGDPGVTLSGGVPTTTPSSIFTSTASSVISYFFDKTLPNVTITVTPPTYVGIDLEVSVNVLPQYKQSEVQSQVLNALRELISINNSSFADVVAPQYILSAVSSAIGVDYATVNYLRKTASLQSATISSWSRTSNVVTATTSAAHGFSVGQLVRVTNSTNGSNDVDTALATVTAVGSTTTFSYVDVGTNGTTITPTGTATAKIITTDTISCATNEIPYEGTFSLTLTGGI